MRFRPEGPVSGDFGGRDGVFRRGLKPALQALGFCRNIDLGLRPRLCGTGLTGLSRRWSVVSCQLLVVSGQ
jgi:hypothetical protein